jgi:hypothetical protein
MEQVTPGMERAVNVTVSPRWTGEFTDRIETLGLGLEDAAGFAEAPGGVGELVAVRATIGEAV